MSMRKSVSLYRRAAQKIPGGVNSPVRAWKAVGGIPRFLRYGHGSHTTDVDQREYIDFVGSWGPLILGHANPTILRRLKQVAKYGTTFGAPTEGEVKLAEAVCQRVPSIQKIRLVNSGTEAAMSALRLARAFTGRTKIVKFDGCYHGHADGLLVKAGSGVATLGLPDSPGIPTGFARETLVATFNDAGSVERLFNRHLKDIAAVIVEPVCGNMGVIPPAPMFLSSLRKITRAHGALLIFDEVITGFRVALGGAQEIYGVQPDLTCLGKILGGGLPLAAFGGKRKIMDLLAPDGPVYQAGTLSGNPLAVSAGLTTLELLSHPGIYEGLEARGKKLQEGFEKVLRKYPMRATINRTGSMMTLFFGVDQVRNAAQARKCDRGRFARFFHGMLKRGIYMPPAPFEAAFLSLAHTATDLNQTIAAFDQWASEETSEETRVARPQTS
ncbi:MAG TPA: glutamate-1-semialdehyde 2,1-aminomutase [Candidatus Binatia bacterium]|nr:glutamate-1-semialdehyde 2,1-aminomutase [Candidatus Binatia bacterium]